MRDQPADPEAVVSSFRNDDYCFVCGKDNPAGLHLKPSAEAGSSSVEWVPAREVQGWEGVTHGGIVTALLDETMAYAAMSTGGSCATAEISVNFCRPVRTGVATLIRGQVVESRGRLVKTKGEMLQNGEVLATASATFVRI